MPGVWVVQTGEASEGSNIIGIFTKEEEAYDLVHVTREFRKRAFPEPDQQEHWYMNLQIYDKPYSHRIWWDSHRVDYISLSFIPLNTVLKGSWPY